MRFKKIIKGYKTSLSAPIGLTGPTKQTNGRIEGVMSGKVFGKIISAERDIFPVHEVLLDDIILGDINVEDSQVDSDTPLEYGFIFELEKHLSENSQTLEIRDKETKRQLRGSPMQISSDMVSGHFDGFTGIEGFGWAASGGTKPPQLELLLDGTVCDVKFTREPRPDFKERGLSWQQVGFRFVLPESALDGKEHELTVRSVDKAYALKGHSGKYKFQLNGYIDTVTRHSVSGWLQVKDYPGVTPIDVYVNGKLACSTKASHRRLDAEEVNGPGCVGFYVDIPRKFIKNAQSALVQCYIGGTGIQLFDTDYFVTSKWRIMESIEQLGAQLKKTMDDERGTIPSFVFAHMLCELRRQNGGIFNINGVDIAVPMPCAPKRKGEKVDIVDIIVPVYKGIDETLECILSVLDAKVSVPYELIVINDFSPEPELTAKLQQLVKKRKFTLLENENNLGFVATVNRGMKLHTDRDVVLLNSDTVVPSGWLEGIRKAAYSEINIGTVTPFSNRATICSLPETLYDNDIPQGQTVQSMHDLCQRANPGVVVDIPTAVGFCMYIKRHTLQEVGYFDEERWKKGYGEENDFCVRASNLGWRNVAACDTFVQHHGSISFQGEKDERVKENLAVLNSLYPDYSHKVQAFIRKDPLATPRARFNIERLSALAPSYMLYVMHSWGGGTEVAAQDMVKLLQEKEDVKVLFLRSDDNGRFVLETPDGNVSCVWSIGSDIEDMARDLSKLNIWHIHYHQTIGFSKDIWSLPDLLGVEYDFTVHDFFTVCPRINFIDEMEIFCGQPEINVCENCVKFASLEPQVEQLYKELGSSVQHWREFHIEKLAKARSVFAPSDDAATKMSCYGNIPNMLPKPHPEPEQIVELNPPRAGDDGILRVALLGAIGIHKGHNKLLACAKYARRHDLPIEFIVIGYTCNDDDYKDLDNVKITGAYDHDDLSWIIAENKCSIALFLSVWPETFSYTLSEAWKNGLYPVAYDIGAPAERIRKSELGFLIPFSSSPAEICQQLLALVSAPTNNNLVGKVGMEYNHPLNDYYRYEPQLINLVPSESQTHLSVQEYESDLLPDDGALEVYQ